MQDPLMEAQKWTQDSQKGEEGQFKDGFLNYFYPRVKKIRRITLEGIFEF